MIRLQKIVIAGLDIASRVYPICEHTFCGTRASPSTDAIHEASPTVGTHHGLPGLAPSARPGNDAEVVINR